MKLLLAKPRGFCAGVERAIDTVLEALRLYGPPIWVKHEIVHNRHVVNELKSKGAIFIEDLNLVPEGERIIFSAHGVSPAVREQAKARNLMVIDATCGLVTRVHSAAKRAAKKGYHVLLIGHRNHVETIGTAGEAPEQTTIIETPEDVEALPFTSQDSLFYITQTTLSLDDVSQIVDALKARFPQIETLPTSSICYATTNRQMALREITNQVDLVLVVGDPMSSNSNRLKECAINRGVPSYLINSPDEICPSWFQEVHCVGMTAGASTPESVVQDCVRRLDHIGVTETEEIVYTIEDTVFSLPQIV